MRPAQSLPVALAAGITFLSGCGGDGDGSSAPQPNIAVFADCLVRQPTAPPPAPLPRVPPTLSLRLETLAPVSGLNAPLFTASPPDDAVRLFVVEQGGVIKVLDRATGAFISTFLDISALVSKGDEQGLLGLAFDPEYGTNRRFYINYTDINGNTVVARYLADPGNPNLVISIQNLTILTLQQPFANHNGGMLAFGQDGFLYIGFGDGGSGGDPEDRAQNLGSLFGKLIRIDVGQAGPPPSQPYSVPLSNPCVGRPGIRGEIWSTGLRNPWRFTFDRVLGDLYVADVGQGAREEVTVSPFASGAGRGWNYGWNVTEGSLCFPGGAACDRTGIALPHVEYDHAQGCSITGGYVYRGSAIPGQQGTYFYGDFCTGFVRSLRFFNGQVSDHFEWSSLAPGGNISSFGEDAQGELYLMTLQGGLFRIVPN